MDIKKPMYGIWFENGSLMKVSVGRPISFKTFCQVFVLQFPELTVESSNQKLETKNIAGIQKIPNDNAADYELTADGRLI